MYNREICVLFLFSIYQVYAANSTSSPATTAEKVAETTKKPDPLSNATTLVITEGPKTNVTTQQLTVTPTPEPSVKPAPSSVAKASSKPEPSKSIQPSSVVVVPSVAATTSGPNPTTKAKKQPGSSATVHPHLLTTAFFATIIGLLMKIMYA